MDQHHCNQQRGFTLIEILIVMVIIGIVAAVAVTRFSPTRGTDVSVAAEELLDLLTVAREEAVLTPALLGLVVTSSEVRWVRYDIKPDDATSRGDWVPYVSDALRPSDILSAMQWTLMSPAVSSTSSSTVPGIVFAMNGDMSPFRLRITDRSGKARWVTHAAGSDVMVSDRPPKESSP